MGLKKDDLPKCPPVLIPLKTIHPWYRFNLQTSVEPLPKRMESAHLSRAYGFCSAKMVRSTTLDRMPALERHPEGSGLTEPERLTRYQESGMPFFEALDRPNFNVEPCVKGIGRRASRTTKFTRVNDTVKTGCR